MIDKPPSAQARPAAINPTAAQVREDLPYYLHADERSLLITALIDALFAPRQLSEDRAQHAMRCADAARLLIDRKAVAVALEINRANGRPA